MSSIEYPDSVSSGKIASPTPSSAHSRATRSTEAAFAGGSPIAVRSVQAAILRKPWRYADRKSSTGAVCPNPHPADRGTPACWCGESPTASGHRAVHRGRAARRLHPAHRADRGQRQPRRGRHPAAAAAALLRPEAVVGPVQAVRHHGRRRRGVRRRHLPVRAAAGAAGLRQARRPDGERRRAAPKGDRPADRVAALQPRRPGRVRHEHGGGARAAAHRQPARRSGSTWSASIRAASARAPPRSTASPTPTGPRNGPTSTSTRRPRAWRRPRRRTSCTPSGASSAPAATRCWRTSAPATRPGTWTCCARRSATPS